MKNNVLTRLCLKSLLHVKPQIKLISQNGLFSIGFTA
jgi:hypothetical protein